MKKYLLDDDIIVVGGDNLFSTDLAEFGEYCEQKKAPVTAVYDVGDLEEIKKYNAIEIDADGRITYFEEKPKVPKSTLTGIALYYYPQSVLPLIDQYIKEGKQSGPARPPGPMALPACAFTWKVPGLWYDVGSIETLKRPTAYLATCDDNQNILWHNAAGAEVYLYTLTNELGYEVSITTYGGAITTLKVPDRNGVFGDIVLGYETLDDYVRNPRYLGVDVTRIASRRAGSLERSRLSTRQKQRSESSARRFQRLRQTRLERDGEMERCCLSYLSKDGEESYPGNLEGVCRLPFVGNELSIEYRASTDAIRS